MKRQIKVIDEERKIIQITTTDERYYVKYDDNEQPTYYPSSTFICDYYYKSPYLINWIVKQGQDEAERIKKLAGERGSTVHQAIVDLIDGKEIRHNAKFISPDTGEEKEITPDEYEAVISFVEWWKAAKPVTLAREVVVFSEEPRYAGTLDWIGLIDNELWLLDWKTSPQVYTSHIIQLSSYKHAVPILPIIDENKSYDPALAKLGILQVGFRKNKKKYKFNEIEDKYNLFLTTYEIWKEETGQKEPKQVEMPISVTLKEEENADTGNN